MYSSCLCIFLVSSDMGPGDLAASFNVKAPMPVPLEADLRTALHSLNASGAEI